MKFWKKISENPMLKLHSTFLLLMICCGALFAQEHQLPEKENKPWVFNDPSWYVIGGAIVYDYPYVSSIAAVEVFDPSERDILTAEVFSTQAGYGYQALIGYNANRYVGVEFEFLQFAAPKKYTSTTTYTDPSTAGSLAYYNTKYLAFGPATLFYLPLSQYFSPYLKFGMYTYYYSNYWNAVTLNISNLYTKSWNIRMIIGYGIRSLFTKHFGLRLEYECPTNQLMNNSGTLIHGDLSLGAIFSF